MIIQTERIDGKTYEVGSAEHAAAKREWRRRYDAAYLKAHQHLVERHLRMLRDASILPDDLRTDANHTAFLARELVHVRGEIELTIYQKLRAKEFVPIEGGHPPGAESYATQRADHVGEAKISTDLAGDDPRADVEKSEDLRKYVNVRASYGYTVQELEHAAMAGIALPRLKSNACADVIARGLDKIGRSGSAPHGLTGFFNNALVTLKTLTLGEWISTATNEEIIADWIELEDDLIAACGDNLPPGGDKPFRFVVPSTVEGALVSRRVDGTNTSLLTYLLANSRVIGALERYTTLDTAVSPDVVAADAPQGIIYARDPSCLFWPFSIVYEEQAPQIVGWEWIQRARARCGGVEVRRPFWMLYVENFD